MGVQRRAESGDNSHLPAGRYPQRPRSGYWLFRYADKTAVTAPT